MCFYFINETRVWVAWSLETLQYWKCRKKGAEPQVWELDANKREGSPSRAPIQVEVQPFCMYSTFVFCIIMYKRAILWQQNISASYPCSSTTQREKVIEQYRTLWYKEKSFCIPLAKRLLNGYWLIYAIPFSRSKLYLSATLAYDVWVLVTQLNVKRGGRAISNLVRKRETRSVSGAILLEGHGSVLELVLPICKNVFFLSL